MKQGFNYSCGAATLICAGKELGCTEFGGWSLANAGQFGDLAESKVYASTSGVRNVSKAGYSYPAGIIQTARQMGLDAHVHIVPNWKTTTLKTFFPNAVEDVLQIGAKVKEGKEKPLEDNQRRLRVLTTQGIGLHYVMERPDGSVMDPESGESYRDLDDLIDAGGWGKNYSNTGLSIVITDPSWRPTRNTPGHTGY